MTTKPSHPISDATLEAGDVAIVGRKGRGKSYAAKGLVERLITTGRRVIVLDPMGHWWGLKASADGTGAGLPIVVFGGDHADVPIRPGIGRALARLVMSTKLSAVVDLGGFYRDDWQSFATAFLRELYHHNRDALWMILEEADLFAPQMMGKDDRGLFHEVEMIARRGRARGFRLISVTQRPASFNKNVLGQLNTMLAFGLTGLQDRKAVQAWFQSSGENAREVFGTLPNLEIGEAWLWQPEEAGTTSGLARVRFPRITTLDTSKTPGVGAGLDVVGSVSEEDIADLQELLEDIMGGGGAPRPERSKRRRRRKVVVNPAARAIVAARTTAGLTQKELAEKLGTDQSNIARLETGRSSPSLRTLEKIATACGLRLHVEYQQPVTESSLGITIEDRSKKEGSK